MERYVFLLEEGARAVPATLLSACGAENTTVFLPEASPAQRRKALEDATVVFGAPTLEELAVAKRLRWVQMFWAGADRYLHGGFPENVRLTTASGAFGQTIAEHMLAMLFALCRRLPAYLRRGNWQDLGAEKIVTGATALILGAGDIGSQLARRLRGLGVHTIGVCRSCSVPRPGFDCLTTLAEAEAYLPEADFVLCALPSNRETDGWLNARRLELLRTDCVLINTGRGRLIDLERLTQCLNNGKFFGVGLDVTEPEPLPLEHPLWQMERVILTPHVAGVSFGHSNETEEAIWHICQENLCRYRSGETLRNEVIFP